MAAAARLKIGGQVERVDGRQLSYADFVRRFLEPNRPVLLTGLMDAWPACADWASADGRPNLPFFAAHFGASVVQVADCSKRELTDQKRLEMSVAEFITYWLEFSAKKENGLSSCKDNDDLLLYLKDWHFVKEYPHYAAYETPPFFYDDWLNMYLDSHVMHRDSDIACHQNEINCADYRFVYMGPKGTWTPLHADVFRSYSWSANVCGRKLWLFLPPSQHHLVFDRNFRTSVYNVCDDISETQFPGFKESIWLECTQEQKEIIFVPSGWYHQVHNLEDTISINHNWVNGYNLSWVWKLLLEDYSVAKEYIEDVRDICDDFEGICQRNLAANTGMNFYDFMIFITRVTLVNLIQLDHIRRMDNKLISSTRKIKHVIHNLNSIRTVAVEMISVEAFTEQNINFCSAENQAAFSDIKKILEEPEFHDLCGALMKTYESIFEQQKSYTAKTSTIPHSDCLLLEWAKKDEEILSSSMVGSSKIQGPEDLLGLIDCVLEMINCTFSNRNFSYSIE